MKTKLVVCLCICVSVVGCARFGTKQVDYRKAYYENGKVKEITKISTLAKSGTFADAKSKLAIWTAEQTEFKQGASVGGLGQESQVGTNLTELVKSVVDGAVKAAIQSIKP